MGLCEGPLTQVIVRAAFLLSKFKCKLSIRARLIETANHLTYFHSFKASLLYRILNNELMQ